MEEEEIRTCKCYSCEYSRFELVGIYGDGRALLKCQNCGALGEAIFKFAKEEEQVIKKPDSKTGHSSYTG